MLTFVHCLECYHSGINLIVSKENLDVPQYQLFHILIRTLAIRYIAGMVMTYPKPALETNGIWMVTCPLHVQLNIYPLHPATFKTTPFQYLVNLRHWLCRDVAFRYF
jgi:hypothetical protein